MGSGQGRGRTGQDQTLPVTGATAAKHTNKLELSVCVCARFLLFQVIKQKIKKRVFKVRLNL